MNGEPLGLHQGEVRLVPYDARWPELFRAESLRLAAALRPYAVRFEHVGSTAVPGLAAKPVLDMLAGYEDTSLLEDIVARLVAAGYTHRGPQGLPERQFLRRGEPRAWHIHLTRIGSRQWREQLGFREALRRDPRLRDAYAGLKHRLAAEFPRERERYIDGKTDFVQRVLEHAAGVTGR